MSISARLLAACLLVAPAAEAATFTVSSPADSGPGTLRQAILDANANPGADQIVFTVPEVTPASAMPDLTGPVAIDGTVGGGRVTIAAVMPTAACVEGIGFSFRGLERQHADPGRREELLLVVPDRSRSGERAVHRERPARWQQRGDRHHLHRQSARGHQYPVRGAAESAVRQRRGHRADLQRGGPPRRERRQRQHHRLARDRVRQPNHRRGEHVQRRIFTPAARDSNPERHSERHRGDDRRQHHPELSDCGDPHLFGESSVPRLHRRHHDREQHRGRRHPHRPRLRRLDAERSRTRCRHRREQPAELPGADVGGALAIAARRDRHAHQRTAHDVPRGALQQPRRRPIVIPITGDLIGEPAETFTVQLSAPTGGATLGAALTTVTISAHTGPEPIPTLSEWSLLALALGLAMAMMLRAR